MTIKLSNGEIVCREIASELDVDDEVVGHPDFIYNNADQKARIDWLIRQRMKKPILDVGTACGYVLNAVGGDRGDIGIDVRCDRLLVAKRKYPKMKFYYANVLNLQPFYGKGIKSAILSEILEHLIYEHAQYAIVHCLRTVDSDGVIYYTVPNADMDRTVDQNPEHKWYPTRNTFNTIMEMTDKHVKVGYTITEVGLFLCGTIWKK